MDLGIKNLKKMKSASTYHTSYVHYITHYFKEYAFKSHQKCYLCQVPIMYVVLKSYATWLIEIYRTSDMQKERINKKGLILTSVGFCCGRAITNEYLR